MSSNVASPDNQPSGVVASPPDPKLGTTERKAVADFSGIKRRGFMAAAKRVLASRQTEPENSTGSRVQLPLAKPLSVLVFGLDAVDCTNTLRLLSLTMAAKRPNLVCTPDLKANRGSLSELFPEMNRHSYNVFHLARAVQHSLATSKRNLSLNELRSYGTVLPNLLLFAGIESDDFGTALSADDIDLILNNLWCVADTIIGDGGSVVDRTLNALMQRFDELVLVLDLSAPSANATVDTFLRIYEGIDRLIKSQSGNLDADHLKSLKGIQDMIQTASLVVYRKNHDTSHRPEDVLVVIKATWESTFHTTGTHVFGVHPEKHLDDIPLALKQVPIATRTFEAVAAHLVHAAYKKEHGGVSPFEQAAPVPAKAAVTQRTTDQPHSARHDVDQATQRQRKRLTITTAVAALGAAVTVAGPATAAHADGGQPPLTSPASTDNVSGGMVDAPQASTQQPQAPAAPANSGSSLSQGSDAQPQSSNGMVGSPAGSATRSSQVAKRSEVQPATRPADASAAPQSAAPKASVTPMSAPAQTQSSRPQAAVPQTTVSTSPATKPVPVQTQTQTPQPPAAAPSTQAPAATPAPARTTQAATPLAASTTSHPAASAPAQASPSAVSRSVPSAAAPVAPAAAKVPAYTSQESGNVQTAPSSQPAASPVPASAPAVATPAAAGPMVGTVYVTNGDSLWTIAETALNKHFGRQALDAEIEGYWEAMYAVTANHAVIGDNPSMIMPGQFLNLPAYR